MIQDSSIPYHQGQLRQRRARLRAAAVGQRRGAAVPGVQRRPGRARGRAGARGRPLRARLRQDQAAAPRRAAQGRQQRHAPLRDHQQQPAGKGDFKI